jgi:hypothetical protein
MQCFSMCRQQHVCRSRIAAMSHCDNWEVPTARQTLRQQGTIFCLILIAAEMKQSSSDLRCSKFGQHRGCHQSCCSAEDSLHHMGPRGSGYALMSLQLMPLLQRNRSKSYKEACRHHAAATVQGRQTAHVPAALLLGNHQELLLPLCALRATKRYIAASKRGRRMPSCALHA